MMLARVILLAVLVFPFHTVFADDRSGTLEDAANAFERGDIVSAEQILNSLLKTRANDPAALGLLGAVLDAEKKFPEAEAAYRSALKLSPNSATLLNNYANHQLAMGDAAGARSSYLRAIAIDPGRSNANLQLAAMAIEKKNGAEALNYLGHLKQADRGAAQVQILTMQALFLAGRNATASDILSKFSESSQSDPRISFSLGLALAAVARYSEAESFFSSALRTAGMNFDILYNLGLAAYHAGDLERARTALNSASAERPNDVDALYNLAVVEIAQKQQSSALQLLVRAARMNSARANVQLTLAQTASALGYYADALPAYENYLSLKPDDVSAQRERDFMMALSRDPREGLAALQTFVEAHPADVTAHYETGILESQIDPVQAKAQLNKALTLQPDFAPALFGRGVVTLLAGDAGVALPDLEKSAAKFPDNAQVLDRLGEAYLALDRGEDAVKVLRKASLLAPNNSRILMHLSRALTKAGLSDEARNTLAQFRAIGPKSGNLIPLPGYLEFLGLSKEQQYSRYAEELQNRMQAEPNDQDVKVRYLSFLVQQGRLDEAAKIGASLRIEDIPARLAAQAGHALLVAGDYDAAKPFLEKSEHALGAVDVELDFAIALEHTSGAGPALDYLANLPEPARTGDYYLIQADVLQAAGRTEAALAAVDKALKRSATRTDLYEKAALFLASHAQAKRAADLAAKAAEVHPDDPAMLLLLAAMLASSNQESEAERVLKRIESRWPEWAPAYITYGAVLDAQHRPQEAKLQIDTAAALGTTTTDVYYFLPKDQFMRSR